MKISEKKMEYRSEYNCYALLKFYVYLSRYGPRASNRFYWYIFFQSDERSSLACHSCRKLRLCNKPCQQYLIFVNERGKRYYVYLPFFFLYSKTASARINWRLLILASANAFSSRSTSGCFGKETSVENLSSRI